MMRTICRTLIVVLMPAIAAAQAPPSAPAPRGTSGAAAPNAAPVLEQSPLDPQGYTYNREGRRDPFVTLLRRGSDLSSAQSGARAPGLAGLAASEIALKGTIAARDGYVAMVQGVDNKTYIVRPGDKLRDGTIRVITADAMVIRQRVNDPLSLEKEREVRKVLRQTEEK